MGVGADESLPDQSLQGLGLTGLGLTQILVAPPVLAFNALPHAARQVLLRLARSPTLELFPQCRRLQL
eukprot:2501094-Rhodomonas_salina.1